MALASIGSRTLADIDDPVAKLVKSQTWANGITETKAYDLQGRLTTWTSANLLNRTFAYDANGNVTQKDASQFQYDPLDRLTWEPGQILQYDGNGNRLLDANGPYSYSPASNRMATGPPGGVTLDAAGNTLAYAGQTYAYNQAGKLVGAATGGQTATYTYRHDGLRASKAVSGVTTFFHYDLAGRLIAETDASGQSVREYIWDDSVPVAQIQAGVITYLHVDHLGTPRLGTNSAGAEVWRWDSDAFGTAAPTGSVTVNLRFPGQYFDAETGLHQNWNRTYHPPSGRYFESDPIGLAGGINTFGYVEGNPLRYVDPYGLWAWGDPLPQGLVDFSAGWGDMLSFGITARIREGLDIGSVNKCSGFYKGGEVFGFTNGLVLGWVQGTKAAAKRSSANNWSNFSHSLIPHSAMKGSNNPVVRWMDKVGNRLNGDFVSPELHTRMDAAAQFGISREFRAANPLFSPFRQLINRVPYVPGAAAYGTGSAAVNSCGCDN